MPTSFSDLRLGEPLLRALAAAEYRTPTPIQTQAIPPLLAGRDVLGVAQTGTGKTAAFALPILHALAQRPEGSGAPRALVFTCTKHGANRIAARLAGADIAAAAVHGSKSQAVRQRALDELRSGRVRVLVATDIAARGLDVEGVSHVINFDIRMNPKATSTASAARRALAPAEWRSRCATVWSGPSSPRSRS